MSKKKYLRKQHFSNIVRGFLKKDLNALPGKESNERYIWSNTEIGEGVFFQDWQNGSFISEVFCKGKGLNYLDDFDFCFLEDKIEKLKSAILVRTTLWEFGVEIQREFQLTNENINPSSKYRIIRHIIEHYKIVHIHGRIEDAVKYRADIESLKSEKIRLLN